MEEEKKVYLGNLDYGLTDEDLHKAVGEKGLQAKDVKIIKDKFTGKSKGFGFAEFESDDQVEQAISVLDGHEVNGRPLKVSKARKKTHRVESYGNGRY